MSLICPSLGRWWSIWGKRVSILLLDAYLSLSPLLSRYFCHQGKSEISLLCFNHGSWLSPLLLSPSFCLFCSWKRGHPAPVLLLLVYPCPSRIEGESKKKKLKASRFSFARCSGAARGISKSRSKSTFFFWFREEEQGRALWPVRDIFQERDKK